MGSRSGFDPGLRFSFFLLETLSITGQKVFKCRKNSSDRLRKGQRQRRHTALNTAFEDKNLLSGVCFSQSL